MEAVNNQFGFFDNPPLFSKKSSMCQKQIFEIYRKPQNISQKKYFLIFQTICSFVFVVNNWLNRKSDS